VTDCAEWILKHLELHDQRIKELKGKIQKEAKKDTDYKEFAEYSRRGACRGVRLMLILRGKPPPAAGAGGGAGLALRY